MMVVADVQLVLSTAKPKTHREDLNNIYVEIGRQRHVAGLWIVTG